jgi:hypothetical protein
MGMEANEGKCKVLEQNMPKILLVVRDWLLKSNYPKSQVTAYFTSATSLPTSQALSPGASSQAGQFVAYFKAPSHLDGMAEVFPACEQASGLSA